jgi:hypothetical protein
MILLHQAYLSIHLTSFLCHIVCLPHQARTLGPWSSAVELVNARQAAAEQRNKQLQQGQHEQSELHDGSNGSKGSSAGVSKRASSCSSCLQLVAA